MTPSVSYSQNINVCDRRQRQIEEQKMISRLDTTSSLNQDLGFLSHYFPKS